MAWSLSFEQDTEIEGVGTATATYTDDGGATKVTHSGRIDNRDRNTISGFIDEALAKFAKRSVADGHTTALLQKIQAVLDEKVK
jgi:cob(I)alamin adenosyltransferase